MESSEIRLKTKKFLVGMFDMKTEDNPDFKPFSEITK